MITQFHNLRGAGAVRFSGPERWLSAAEGAREGFSTTVSCLHRTELGDSHEVVSGGHQIGMHPHPLAALILMSRRHGRYEHDVEVNSERDRFVGSLGHDLRNPVNVLIDRFSEPGYLFGAACEAIGIARVDERLTGAGLPAIANSGFVR